MEKVKKKKHVMIDLETFGLTADSLILSIGAVAFDMDGTIGAEIELFPDVESQIGLRKIEWSTIQWWMKQEADARLSIADAKRDGWSLETCLQNLTTFCNTNLDEKFKAWGNGFDIPLLNHAYSQFKMKTPWSYKRIMDCRTICWLSKISTRKYEGTGIKHSAVADCKWQISWTVDAYKILNDF